MTHTDTINDTGPGSAFIVRIKYSKRKISFGRTSGVGGWQGVLEAERGALSGMDSVKRAGRERRSLAGGRLDFLEEPGLQESPHLWAPSARAIISPTTNRNMATDSSTVMTTMPPVRAIPNPIDSMFLPVRRR